MKSKNKIEIQLEKENIALKKKLVLLEKYTKRKELQLREAKRAIKGLNESKERLQQEVKKLKNELRNKF